MPQGGDGIEAHTVTLSFATFFFLVVALLAIGAVVGVILALKAKS